MNIIAKKPASRVFLGTAVLLMIPAIAMQFTREVNWGPGDFLVAAVLLIGSGLLFQAAMSKLSTRRFRLAAGSAVVLGLLLVWAELAVGIFH
ncbi:hypothetical protein [Pseudoduganella rhizocola]|uniref:hypothetical protein n=1 Tax=Pseudoduganella rhizocola TaxID=3382643 RepID=UPI0038B695E3